MTPLKGYQHGANLGHWLSQYSGRSEAHWDSYITRRDIARMAAWGLDHVRLPVDYMLFEPDENAPSVYDEGRLAYIDRVIGWCGEIGLNLILDLHHAPGFFFGDGDRNDLFTSDRSRERFLRIWKMFAERYQHIGGSLIFELLNELVWENSDPWNELWQDAAAVIWSVDPARRIIVGGNRWNSMDELKNLAVTDDARIIYTFHCYEPFWFTHQRASWIEGMRSYEKPCGYPFRPADFADYHDGQIPRDYAGYDVVDRTYLENRLKSVTDFIARTGHTVYCGEYGAIANCPREDALRWLNDIGSILRENGIGRAVWSYRGFAAITAPDDESWDADMVRAIAR